MKIGCIGCGTMGGALIKAMAQKFGGENFFVSAKHYEKAESFAREIGGTACRTNAEVAEKSDLIFIAVKPAFVESVLDELADFVDKIYISMAAGLKLETLCGTMLGMQGAKFGRIMPNLPAVYKEGMTALCYNEGTFSEEEINQIVELLDCAGKTEIVPEKLMDGVTAVSGSGPAYVFMFIEALADAAVKFGIPRSQSYTYAAQTVKGAATMVLEDSRSVGQLKDGVCSPAGTTIEGVIALENAGLRNAVIQGATAAFNRSVELGKK